MCPCHLLLALRICTFSHVYTHAHLGTQSYLDTCPLGWEPGGPRSSPLCTARSGLRPCCGCTGDTCLSGGRSSRRHWGPRCCYTGRADKASRGHVPQTGPRSSRRHRARSGRLEGAHGQARGSSLSSKATRRGRKLTWRLEMFPPCTLEPWAQEQAPGSGWLLPSVGSRVLEHSSTSRDVPSEQMLGRARFGALRPRPLLKNERSLPTDQQTDGTSQRSLSVPSLPWFIF